MNIPFFSCEVVFYFVPGKPQNEYIFIFKNSQKHVLSQFSISSKVVAVKKYYQEFIRKRPRLNRQLVLLK